MRHSRYYSRIFLSNSLISVLLVLTTTSFSPLFKPPVYTDMTFFCVTELFSSVSTKMPRSHPLVKPDHLPRMPIRTSDSLY